MLNQYLDVLSSLNSHKVRYLTIGGIAAIIHGVPRMTFDLDILIEASEENAAKLLAALEEAHMGTALLTTPEKVASQEITIFSDRVRLDVQTRTPGIDFESAYARCDMPEFGGIIFPVASKNDLISAKLASGRPVDLSDVSALKEE